jgi:hypothetical protein
MHTCRAPTNARVLSTLALVLLLITCCTTPGRCNRTADSAKEGPPALTRITVAIKPQTTQETQFWQVQADRFTLKFPNVAVR